MLLLNDMQLKPILIVRFFPNIKEIVFIMQCGFIIYEFSDEVKTFTINKKMLSFEMSDGLILIVHRCFVLWFLF